MQAVVRLLAAKHKAPAAALAILFLAVLTVLSGWNRPTRKIPGRVVVRADGKGEDPQLSRLFDRLEGSPSRDLSRAFAVFPPQGKDFPRYPILADFAEWVEEEPRFACGSLFVGGSGDDPELKLLDCSQHMGSDWQAGAPLVADNCLFDGTARCDLHQLAMGRKYDFILLSQTFEHIYDPPLAMCRVQQHSRPGTWLFLSLPTYNRPHMVPSHFRHYTPRGLVTLLADAGFETVRLGAFGSRRYVEELYRTDSWPDYSNFLWPWQAHLPQQHEDMNYVVQTWALARYVSSSGSGSGSGSGGIDCSPAALSSRPLVDLKHLESQWLQLWSPAAKPWKVPTLRAAAALAGAVPSARTNEAVDTALFMAGAGISSSIREIERQAAILRDAPAAVLTHGSIAALLPKTTRMDTLPIRAGDVAPGGPFKLAVLSDVLETRIDALDTLLALKPQLEAGAAVYIACRVHAPLQLRAVHLTTCMPSGLTTVMSRAGMTIEASGGWGTPEAYKTTLLEGQLQPAGAWLDAHAEALAEAVKAHNGAGDDSHPGSQAVPSGGFNDLLIVWARGRWV